MLRKIFISIIFLSGMLIFFYPMVGNWLSTKDHYSAISKHNEALAQMNEREKVKEKEKAQLYNETITESFIPVTDPFANITEELDRKEGSYYDILDIGEAMGTLEIPNIDVKLPIYHGISEEVLSRGIGHMSNSSFPIGGQGTHTALTGHRGLPSAKLFRDLDKLEIGDVFYIHTLGEVLAYKVDDIKVVLPTETQWLQMDENKDYVTLITCEPYMINTHRLLVRGERTAYEPDGIVEIKHVPKDSLQRIELILFIGGLTVITAIFLIIALQYSKKKGWAK